MTEGAAVAPVVATRLRGRAGFGIGFAPNVSLTVGVSIILLVLLASIFAGVLSPYDPIQQDLRNALQPPSAEHLFGTDNYGRDIFSRVLHAAKLDLMIGFLCVFFPWM